MEQEPRRLPLRFYEIDLLRFLAALSVIFYHYTFQGYLTDSQHRNNPLPFLELSQFTRYGYLGVELFFVISGYVVLMSAQGKTIRQFFISRITRLYPAFWVACTLTFLVKRIWGAGSVGTNMADNLHAGPGQYLYNMTMLYDFFGIKPLDGAYWSLTIEIAFYFLMSLLIAYKLMRHVDAFLLVWLVLASLPGLSHFSFFFTLFFPNYAPYFAAGMLFYLLQQPNGQTLRRYLLLAFSYLLAIKSCVVQSIEMTTSYHTEFTAVAVVSIITIIFLVFYLVTFRKIDLSRHTWLAWLGALTYPLYLIHSDIAYILFHYIGPLFNKYIVLSGTLLLMLVIAYLIHVLVEKRLSKPMGKFVNDLIIKFNI